MDSIAFEPPRAACCPTGAPCEGAKACKHSSTICLVTMLTKNSSRYPGLEKKLTFVVLDAFLARVGPAFRGGAGDEYIVGEMTEFLNRITDAAIEFGAGEIATIVSNARVNLHPNIFPTVDVKTADAERPFMVFSTSVICAVDRQTCVLCAGRLPSSALRPCNEPRTLDGRNRKVGTHNAYDAAGPFVCGGIPSRKPALLLVKRCVNCKALQLLRERQPGVPRGLDVLHFSDHAAVYADDPIHGSAPSKVHHFVYADFDAPGTFFQYSSDTLIAVDTLSAQSTAIYAGSCSYAQVCHCVRSTHSTNLSHMSLLLHRHFRSRRRSMRGPALTASRVTCLNTRS